MKDLRIRTKYFRTGNKDPLLRVARATALADINKFEKKEFVYYELGGRLAVDVYTFGSKHIKGGINHHLNFIKIKE